MDGKWKVCEDEFLNFCETEERATKGVGTLVAFNRLVQDIRVEFDNQSKLKVLNLNVCAINGGKIFALLKFAKLEKINVMVLTGVKHWDTYEDDFLKGEWYRYVTHDYATQHATYLSHTRAGVAILVRKEIGHVSRVAEWPGLGIQIQLKYNAPKYLKVEGKTVSQNFKIQGTEKVTYPNRYERINIFAIYMRPKLGLDRSPDEWSRREP